MPLSQYQYDFFSELFKNEYYSKSGHLEIGCFNGEGIKFLAERFPEKKFTVIDPFIEDGNTIEHSTYALGGFMKNVRSECLKNFKNLNNITLHELTTQNFINQLLKDKLSYSKQLEDINCINIDGSHHYDDIIIDIDLAIYLLKGKIGCIHFDDCYNIHDVCKAVLKYFIYKNCKNIISCVETGPDSMIFNLNLI